MSLQLVAKSMLPSLVVGLALFAGCTAEIEFQPGVEQSDWPNYGGGQHGKQFSSLTQINRNNVQHLKKAWEYRFPATGDSEVDGLLMQLQVQPIVVDDTLFACTPTARVFALDAETGQQRWLYAKNIRVRPRKGYPVKCRGVAYWQQEAVQQITAHHVQVSTNNVCRRRIFVGNEDAELVALDADTGLRCEDFGNKGAVFLYEGVEGYQPGMYGVTSAPLVVKNLVVMGARVDDNLRLDAPSGVVRAYDAKSGALRWAWNSVPPGQSQSYRTADGELLYRAGTVNSWAPMSADEELGLVYVPTGNPSPDLYGGMREQSDYYGSSVVALDIESGRLRWHFQTVHHDVWDYDVPSIPALFQHPEVGGGAKALAQPTKLGHIFLLDRASGEPLYPVEERPVPAGGVAGEVLSPTQPFPTHPVSLHPRDPVAWGFTPFDKRACEKSMQALRWDGPFTPPSLQGSLQFPGTSGGINWGSAAIDQQNGVLFVNQTHLAWVVKLIPRAEMENYSAELLDFPSQLFPMAGTPYGALRTLLTSPLGAPCVEPPWGTLSAIDLASGELLWQKPLGTTRDLAPWPLWMNTGTPNFGGVLATAGGLVFSTGTTDHFLRAFDAGSGEELLALRTDGIIWATPMTYQTGSSGLQRIVVAVSDDEDGVQSGESSFKLVAYDLAQLQN